MKTNILIIILMIIFPNIFLSQERNDYASKWSFKLYDFGSINFEMNDLNNNINVTSVDNYRFNSPTLELNVIGDWISWNVTAFSSFIGGIHEVIKKEEIYKTRSNSWIEAGIGFSLNNKKPLKIAPSSNLIFQIGINLGVSDVKVTPKNIQLANELYFGGGHIGPTFAANIQIGDKINIHNVIETSVYGSSNDKGRRIEFYSTFNYFLTNKFGLNFTPTYQKYMIKDRNGYNEITTKARFFQLGITLKFD